MAVATDTGPAHNKQTQTMYRIVSSYRIGVDSVEKRRLGSLFVLLFVSHLITIT